mmetsp:Transcript_47535/g.94524  ORF Transcript_47535/g.94524 Transcript_47535/m.94524 type:complete len:85 (-) Transcript_47535:152-406(-)
MQKRLDNVPKLLKQPSPLWFVPFGSGYFGTGWSCNIVFGIRVTWCFAASIDWRHIQVTTAAALLAAALFKHKGDYSIQVLPTYR